MKKIIAIIALFISVVAYGQIIDTGERYELHIGEYVLVGSETAHKYLKYGALEYRSANSEECDALGKFIDANKERLEDKFDIIIKDYVYGKVKEGDYRVIISTCDPDTYKKAIEATEKRIKSLESVL